MKIFIEFISKYLPAHVAIPIILHTIILAAMMYIWPREVMEVAGLKKVFAETPLTTIISTAILLYLVILASYIYLCFMLHKNLKPKFGVLWDKNNEPYCPIHEKPLARHRVKLNNKSETGLNCSKCSQTYELVTDDGKRITVPEARKGL
jgi:hypothetical protein